MVEILAAPQPAKADEQLRTLAAISAAHWVSHFHMFVLPMLFPFLKEQLWSQPSEAMVLWPRAVRLDRSRLSFFSSSVFPMRALRTGYPAPISRGQASLPRRWSC